MDGCPGVRGSGHGRKVSRLGLWAPGSSCAVWAGVRWPEQRFGPVGPEGSEVDGGVETLRGQGWEYDPPALLGKPDVMWG